jgi:hypothetical protein
MPSNFRDAFIVTRKLGYKYLWIDSLCIIRDSKEDWERESAVMGNIYTIATLAIAAAATNDSDGAVLETNYESINITKFELSKWFLINRMETNKYSLAKTKADRPKSNANLMCRIKLHSHSSSSSVQLTPWSALSDSEENWFRCVVVGPLAHRG